MARRASDASKAGEPPAERESMWRTLTRQSTYSERDRDRERYDTGEGVENDEDYGQWQMRAEVEARDQEDRASNLKRRKLGVTWNNLSVYGEGQDAAVHENFLSQFQIPTHVAEGRRKKAQGSKKTIITDIHGSVKPGEMLLVLGRPGAGCTTLLNMLANRRFGYAEVTGDVHWGTMDHKQAKQYRGQIVMNTEEEVHFPTLTVGQTMDFATRMKVPATRPGNLRDAADYQKSTKDFLLRSMGIQHTNDTKVGNEYVRGVSGGERKRVSIIETMAARGSVYCWDNSTRGLDASTALEWARAIRAMTDVLGLASIVTLYQAGNGIYNLFDKVLVLDQGREIFFGHREEARPFMEQLGFVCNDSANVADFLTGITVATERKIKPGYENRFPRDAQAIKNIYDKSDIRKRMETEYTFFSSDDASSNTAEFREAIVQDKHKSLPKKSPLTISLSTQIRHLVVRQYEITWGDKGTFLIKQISGLVQALIVGSLFYMAPNSSPGLFIKSGALFYGLLYVTLVAMSETIDSFSGRPVLAKHKDFAFYHPASFCAAQILADVPILILEVTVFGVILYFLTGLKTTAAAFFTFWFVLYSTAACMTAFFRFIGAAFGTFDDASKVSGFAMSAFLTYVGYEIWKPDMHPWFVWIFW